MRKPPLTASQQYAANENEPLLDAATIARLHREGGQVVIMKGRQIGRTAAHRAQQAENKKPK